MNALTVSALSTYIVALFERDELLRDVAVVGEVSNWKRAASGHVYFSLKDAGANIAAVMWRGSAQAHTWLPREGDQVVAFGYVGIYPERGVYQLYANRLLPAGRGQLYAQFEELKVKLAAAGLFAPERKRPLPTQVQRIGVITSADAAALRDILRVLAERWPLVEVVVFPTLVQGADAPSMICEALRCANHHSDAVESLDLLILARGGGSIEDLWAFNDEQVAYAVAASALPVVTGVGHETDHTIVDFVADLRAPTPSAAAAAVVPDRVEALGRIHSYMDWIGEQLAEQIEDERHRVDQAARRLLRTHPQRQIDLRRQSLDDRDRRLAWAVGRRFERLAERGLATQRRLEALNPVAVLRRGYSIVQRQTGEVVTQPARLAVQESLAVRAAGGSYLVRVERTGEPAEAWKGQDE
jgi:exodeoxyribonuclease VII large subunit